jgi:uncharacterized protein (TIGR03435 family)
MRRAVFLLLSVLTFGSAIGQGPRFDVVSVRRAGAQEDVSNSFMRGGPGTSDPERMTWRAPLVRLLVVAYGLDFDQISGPGWLGSEYYDIVANVPRGATKEQVRLMWKNVLVERFQLKAHIVQRDFPVYELSIAKNGPKLRESGAGTDKQEPGFPVLKPGVKWGVLVVPPRNVRQTFRDYSMAEFVQRLGWPLGTLGGSGGLTIGRVLDKTGLDGHYDFTLEFAGAWGPGGAFPKQLPDGETDTASILFDAVRQQLGLELKEKKAPLDVLVVDQIDKVPAEN